MNINISKTIRLTPNQNAAVLIKDVDSLPSNLFSKEEIQYIKTQISNEKTCIAVNRYSHMLFVVLCKGDEINGKYFDGIRKSGAEIAKTLNDQKYHSLRISGAKSLRQEVLSLCEGVALSTYQFLDYKTPKEKKENNLSDILIVNQAIEQEQLDELSNVIQAVYHCRDLVNEPVCTLNAVELSERFKKMASDAGAAVEVLNHKKIEALKMGGLLAVNRGSIDPPSFTIMEWKPENAVNENPVVLMGKGVVYDTGGVNIKTGSFMNDMKMDMAGAATMGSVLYAVAKNKLPLHVIALMPATDNRPGGNAYVPGDVLTMYDGTTVEVHNTDAEGRLIMADALSWAKQYKPELVIDAATLTGAAVRAIGTYGLVAVQQKADEQMQQMKQIADDTYERIAEFPFWEEYGEEIKSKVADIKNLGGSYAGTITAGKFLAHFTDYPYIHLDIAGPAWNDKSSDYKTFGGSGFGVRMLYNYLKAKSQK